MFIISYISFIFDEKWKFFLGRIGVGEQHFDDCLGKTFHVSFPDFGIGAFQFGNDIEALRELSEDVHHRIGEKSVLAATLELQIHKENVFIT